MSTPERYALLLVTLVLTTGAIVYLQQNKPSIGDTGERILALGETSANTNPHKRAREIVNPSGFINSPVPDGLPAQAGTGQAPFTIGDYVGKKVILIDIWTYSCINCQRTLPYITAWHETYADDGLLIIGIHTPEFEFEKVYDNVKKATEKFGIEYPVVLDNDYGTWNNYENRYWPRKYLIDINGNIVYDHIGEGGYKETEQKIKELLQERALFLGEQPPSFSTESPRVQTAPTSTGARTPEIYFGAWRNELLGNGARNTEGQVGGVFPEILLPHHFYLGGSWNIAHEYAEATAPDASIQLRYSGQAVHMVAEADTLVRMRVLIDGKPIPESMRGAHVRNDGYVEVHDATLYNLVNDTAGWGEHTLELIIEKPGLKAFTFTFG